eukprot:CAMPEP_0194502132 /NCGR_PEP_ID=MMETSP0253-20130528/24539_1 /TAXON_ID=2966 /ORGANISM="Noctiluca scintillans" /LENGTH=115 /DNA_ID=CAMNT_0039344229 /DNA_START=55 /DNA_END=403 /DNA_ORIENTATION=-
MLSPARAQLLSEILIPSRTSSSASSTSATGSTQAHSFNQGLAWNDGCLSQASWLAEREALVVEARDLPNARAQGAEHAVEKPDQEQCHAETLRREPTEGLIGTARNFQRLRTAHD